MWKLFQIGLFFWIMFSLMANEAMNDSRGAQAIIALLATRAVTEFLSWLIWLPGRLQHQWSRWRRERIPRRQTLR